jgi:hypothetical protein
LELEANTNNKASDIIIEFQDENEEGDIAGQTITICVAYGVFGQCPGYCFQRGTRIRI